MGLSSEENEESGQFDLTYTKEFTRSCKKLDYNQILKDTDILYLGETHIDYTIPDHLKNQSNIWKQNGVVAVGLELNPKDKEIIDEVNKGDFSRLEKLNLSGGWGSIQVELLKRTMVKNLIKEGITIFPIANWSKSVDGEKSEYTKESEENAARIIETKAKAGKIVILIGERHAYYAKDDYRKGFVNSSDILKNSKKVKSLYFVGGMDNPYQYDKSNEALIRRATQLNGISDKLLYFDANQKGYPKNIFRNDGLIHLPQKQFLSAKDRSKS
jgi:hypothetical protein